MLLGDNRRAKMNDYPIISPFSIEDPEVTPRIYTYQAKIKQKMRIVTLPAATITTSKTRQCRCPQWMEGQDSDGMEDE